MAREECRRHPARRGQRGAAYRDHHRGRSGAPVLSSARGVVEKIGTMRGFGHYVIIKHERHYLTVYSRMSGINVSEGDTVGRGRMIGTQGDELHFQINRAGRPLDPLALLPDRG